MASGLSCPVACEILDQGSNLCSLHWKSDPYPVDYQGNPTIVFKNLHFAALVRTYLITEEDPLFNFFFATMVVCISPSAKRNLVGVGVCAGICKGSEGFDVRWEQFRNGHWALSMAGTIRSGERTKPKCEVGLWRKMNKEPGHAHAKPLSGKGFDHHIINLEQSLHWYILKLHLNVK